MGTPNQSSLSLEARRRARLFNRFRARGDQRVDKSAVADLSHQLALSVFAAVEALSLVLFLVLSRFAWFAGDEWAFLATRSVGNLDDLFRPHNEHWSTLPILAFRTLWWLVGLHSYLPYLALVVMLHLIAAALLRVVMRRAGVGPWVSTAAASVFALFGAGYQDIITAFQIGFAGALVFGFTHLLLADHDGPVDRRDYLGLLAGLAGLMCSGVAVVMTGVVGLAVLVRRGRRAALFHAAPLGAIYLVWLLSIGHRGYTGTVTVGQALGFMSSSVRKTFGAIGQFTGVGVALSVLLVVGLILAWGPARGADLRRRAAAPGALLLGSIAFLFITGLGRAKFSAPGFPTLTQPTTTSRYLHIAAAMFLPALAVAADAVSRRARFLAPLVLLLLVSGIPSNVHALADQVPDRRAYRHYILSLPRLPVAKRLPRSELPDVSNFDVWVRMGWLLDGVESGRIPGPGRISPTDAAKWTLDLVFRPTQKPQRGKACQVLMPPFTRQLNKGDSIAFTGTIDVRYLPETGGRTPPTPFGLFLRHPTYAAVVGPINLEILPSTPGQSVVFCRSDP